MGQDSSGPRIHLGRTPGYVADLLGIDIADLVGFGNSYAVTKQGRTGTETLIEADGDLLTVDELEELLVDPIEEAKRLERNRKARERYAARKVQR